MEINKVIHNNLESQLEQYNKLLAFANEKATILSRPSSDQDVNELNALVREEVKVVSVLHELESHRQEVVARTGVEEANNQVEQITETAVSHKLVEDSDLEDLKAITEVKKTIREVAVELKRVNEKNSIALEVSLRIINKIIQSVKDMTAPDEHVYSRVKKPNKPQSLGSLNFTV